MSLASPSARPLSPWISRLIRLSWASPALSLPPVDSPGRPLPVGVSTFLWCAGSTRCASCSVLVDFHHLDGLLRSGGSGMLQPDPDRVRCVSRCPPSCRLLRGPEDPRSKRSSSQASFPATRFIPFEAFPSPVAVPHHCGRCPPAVVVPRSRQTGPKSGHPEAARDADPRWRTPPERYPLAPWSLP